MSRRTGLLLAGALLSVLVVAMLLGLSNLEGLRERAHEIRWRWAGLAALLAVGSYACIAGVQASLLSILGVRVPAWFYLRACMVSVVVARTLRSGGTSGIAFLAIVLSRRGVPVVATLSMGLGNVLVNACVAAIFVFAGVVLLLLRPHAAGSAATWGYAGGAAALGGGILAAWIVLTRDGVRWALLGRAAALAERLGRRFRREGWGERLRDGGERASGAARQLLRHPVRAWRAWAWGVLRLVASVLSLGACTRAVGIDLPAEALLLAFTAMKMSGSLAFVPAGLGVVDGTLVGMLTLLGAPYEGALLAAALHRVAYHVVPAVVALLLAGPLLGELRRGASPTAPGPDCAGGSASRSS